jgi:hypothetical protein
MSDDPPICKSNGFALQRKPNGGRITLNAASIRGISVFNKRDCKTAERYWSSNHIQHSAQLPDSCTYRKAGVCAEGG